MVVTDDEVVRPGPGVAVSSPPPGVNVAPPAGVAVSPEPGVAVGPPGVSVGTGPLGVLVGPVLVPRLAWNPVSQWLFSSSIVPLTSIVSDWRAIPRC